MEIDSKYYFSVNTRFTIRKSKIAGKGIFSSGQFTKGETVYFLKGELCSLDEILLKIKDGRERASDPLNIDVETYLDLDEISRTFNHSCNPNCFIRGKNELVAMRNIIKGEEITYDYSTTMKENKTKIEKFGRKPWTCKCNCGSKNCRGIIDQFDTIPKITRDYYAKNKYLPDYILKTIT